MRCCWSLVLAQREDDVESEFKRQTGDGIGRREEGEREEKNEATMET